MIRRQNWAKKVQNLTKSEIFLNLHRFLVHIRVIDCKKVFLPHILKALDVSRASAYSSRYGNISLTKIKLKKIFLKK